MLSIKKAGRNSRGKALRVLTTWYTLKLMRIINPKTYQVLRFFVGWGTAHRGEH
jgi:hypothetical protein